MKPKIIAMIPVLLGSKRVKDKNLLLVNGWPLPSYVIKAVKAAEIFDEIYLNSENEIFKKLTKIESINFFKRNSSRGGSKCTMKNKSRNCQGRRCQVHDHFIADFLKKIKCDYIIQIHTTSPLLKPETIKAFVKKLTQDKYDSLFSIKKDYTEAFFNHNPINFIKGKKQPTQSLKPLQVISWALSGWKSQSFLNSYHKNDPDDPGPTFAGKMGLFPINKIEALDIDNWDDLFIAEACLAFQLRRNDKHRFYFNEDIKEVDSDVIRLINRDGVSRFNLSGFNQPHLNFKKIIKKMGPAPWTYPIIYTDRDQVCLIAQQPGGSCRKHYHVTKDEWWIIIKGEFKWNTPQKTIKAKEGDVVFLKKGTAHKIVCTSKKFGVRLACGARGMEHIYVK